MSHPDSTDGATPESAESTADTPPPPAQAGGPEAEPAQAAGPETGPAPAGGPEAGRAQAGGPESGPRAGATGTGSVPGSTGRVPEYPMALEPPDPSPPVPRQASGGHDDAPPPREFTATGEATDAAGAGTAAAAGAGSPSTGRGRTALVVVAVIAGLALVGSGVLGFLWWDTDRELTETRDRLTSEVELLTGQSADQQEEISSLERELQHSADELAITQRDLEGAQNRVDQLRDEQGVIRRCVALNAEVVDAILSDDQAAFDAVVDEAEEVCDEADSILAG